MHCLTRFRALVREDVGLIMTEEISIDTEQTPERERPETPPAAAVLAHAVGDFMLDKKVTDLIVLDITKVSSLGDYMVIGTTSSSRQSRALTKDLDFLVKDLGAKRIGTSGRDGGWWVLVDLGDVIVHLMDDEARQFYNLEAFWSDAEVVRRSTNVA